MHKIRMQKRCSQQSVYLPVGHKRALSCSEVDEYISWYLKYDIILFLYPLSKTNDVDDPTSDQKY